MVTWDAIDEKDTDWLLNDATEPSLEYMSWGVWAMASSDGLIYKTGAQPSAVHMGSWYAGDLLDVSDWPISRTASLAGIAMMDVFARIENNGSINSYAWTEGSRASGNVVFDGSGDYSVSITLSDLGSENCPNTYCGSGFTSNMSKGAMGNITWQASSTNGNASFSSSLSSNNGLSGDAKISELKKCMEIYLVNLIMLKQE